MTTLVDRLVEYETLAWRYLVAVAGWETATGEVTEDAPAVAECHRWAIAKLAAGVAAGEEEKAA